MSVQDDWPWGHKVMDPLGFPLTVVGWAGAMVLCHEPGDIQTCDPEDICVYHPDELTLIREPRFDNEYWVRVWANGDAGTCLLRRSTVSKDQIAWVRFKDGEAEWIEIGDE